MLAQTARLTVFSVSRLTNDIKNLLETGLGYVAVEGEISGLRTTSSKHLYFNLKDEKASIKVVWFNWNAKGISCEPQEGQQVRVQGRLTVYEPQGVYQIVVASLETVGLGDILARLEFLKQKLEQEGLFDSSGKKSCPQFSLSIGLITSPTGAALQDILRIFHQNELKVPVRIFPVLVQGQEAPDQIAAMVDYVGRHRLAEIVVLTRGGGSVEDLLAFSDEAVVRAVASCPLPIISAVGHQIDFPLTDFAADLRCPTPTAAAEYLSRPWIKLKDNLDFFKNELFQALHLKIERARIFLRDFSTDELEETYRTLIQPTYQRLDEAKEALLKAIVEKIALMRQRVSLNTIILDNLNPLEVLKRGYAMVSDQTGCVLTNAQKLKPNDKISIRFYQGQASARVEDIDEKL